MEDEDDKLLRFRASLLETLSAYVKAMKTEGSWPHYYITNLKLKPPTFVFNESKEQFEVKLRLLLDIMDLAHLYCKITNPKEYDPANHVSHRSTLVFLTKGFAELSENQFYDLRGYLKINVTFGKN